MADDALDLLDFMKIEKAHLFGLSLGGPVAGLVTKKQPEKILSVALIATSPDFRPLNLALEKKPIKEGLLSSPTQKYLDFMAIFLENPPETDEEMLEARVETWGFLASSHLPFNEKRERELQAEFLKRMRHPEGLANHIKANMLSEELIRKAFCHLEAPVVIFHGTVDPIFPVDHGQALADEIRDSKLLLIPNMGHGIHETLYPLYIEEIKSSSSRDK
ncbi:alpha/beta fold hydrolase [Simkania sp.]|uniref:alpha/beta fold hydrolase n=1 Tax=Simkania sp. TaxID=34094 RepID=UPI003B52765F